MKYRIENLNVDDLFAGVDGLVKIQRKWNGVLRFELDGWTVEMDCDTTLNPGQYVEKSDVKSVSQHAAIQAWLWWREKVN